MTALAAQRGLPKMDWHDFIAPVVSSILSLGTLLLVGFVKATRQGISTKNVEEIKDRAQFRQDMASWVVNLQGQIDDMQEENRALRAVNRDQHEENLKLKTQVAEMGIKVHTLERELAIVKSKRRHPR